MEALCYLTEYGDTVLPKAQTVLWNKMKLPVCHESLVEEKLLYVFLQASELESLEYLWIPTRLSVITSCLSGG